MLQIEVSKDEYKRIVCLLRDGAGEPSRQFQNRFSGTKWPELCGHLRACCEIALIFLEESDKKEIV